MQLRRRPAPAGDDTLFSQLSVLHDMVKWDAGRPFLPTIVFGDINIPATVANHYVPREEQGVELRDDDRPVIMPHCARG